MIVQTSVEFKSDYGLKIPSDFRLYDVPDTHIVEKLVNTVEREHIRQIIQQVTGSKFSNEHLDAMQQIAVRLVATFNDWIATDDELPKPFEKVLVYIKTPKKVIIDTDSHNPELLEYGVRHSFVATKHEVTHWRPLPHPPKILK